MIQVICNFIEKRVLMKTIRQIKVKCILLLTFPLAIFFSCNKHDEQPYDEIRFNSKLDYGSVTDIDGNTYKTIKIGNQIWLAENLRVTQYSDGTPITLVQDPKKWESLYSEGYCDYEKTYEVYGRLYNYYAAASERNICPSGWHLPDNSDWLGLATYLGGMEIAGMKLKETGPVHWGYYNTLSTNESGFTALPGGLRDHRGSMYSMGNSQGGAGDWWSSTANDSTTVWINSLGGEGIYLLSTPYALKRDGHSVRCIKD